MVFVSSNLTRGDATWTLAQVSVNDMIVVFAFAPIAAFLLGVTDIFVPWDTLLLSVGLYVLLLLLFGYLTRRNLVSKGGETLLTAMIDSPVLGQPSHRLFAQWVRLCRPNEAVLDLLDRLPLVPMAKEDSMPVIDAKGHGTG